MSWRAWKQLTFGLFYYSRSYYVTSSLPFISRCGWPEAVLMHNPVMSIELVHQHESGHVNSTCVCTPGWYKAVSAIINMTILWQGLSLNYLVDWSISKIWLSNYRLCYMLHIGHTFSSIHLPSQWLTDEVTNVTLVELNLGLPKQFYHIVWCRWREHYWERLIRPWASTALQFEVASWHAKIELGYDYWTAWPGLYTSVVLVWLQVLIKGFISCFSFHNY